MQIDDRAFDALERVNQEVLDRAIARAIADERERCAKIAETEEEAEGEPDASMLAAMNLAGPVLTTRAAIRATKKSIAARIRNATG